MRLSWEDSLKGAEELEYSIINFFTSGKSLSCKCGQGGMDERFVSHALNDTMKPPCVKLQEVAPKFAKCQRHKNANDEGGDQYA